MNLVKQLESIEHNFRVKKDTAIPDIIAKYYKKCNGHKNGKMRAKTESEAKKVMNLCVSYKFLLHNHLIQTCFDNAKKQSFVNTEDTK